MKTIKQISLILILTFSSTGYAIDRDDWKLSIGPAVMLKNNLRLNNSYSNMNDPLTYRFIPFLEGRYNRVTLGQNGLSLRIFGDFAIHTNVFINYAGDKYYSDQMEKRRASAFMGLNFKYKSSQFTLAKDVQARSRGMEFRYSYSKFRFITPKWILIHSYTLSYHDNKYAHYYYGVNEHEATDKRKAFKAKGYFVPSVGILPVYTLSEHLSGTVGAFLKYIPQSITSSPTMKGKQLELSTLLGMSYNL